MRVTSKLADVDFAFGKIERSGTMLVIHSDDAQAMKTVVHMTPSDFLAFVRTMACSKGALMFLLFFPCFWLKHRRDTANGLTAAKVATPTSGDDPW